jgi:hypothetical protein
LLFFCCWSWGSHFGTSSWIGVWVA